MVFIRTLVVCSAAALVAFVSAGAATSAPGPAPLVLGIDAGGGPYFQANTVPGCLGSQNVYSRFCWLDGGLAAFDFTQGGLHVAVGDVTGDGRPDIVTVPGRGGRPELRVFDGAGRREPPTLYDGPETGGHEIAVGDVDGDGRADFVLANESGGEPDVQILDGRTGKQLSAFNAATDSSGQYGVRVAVGDVNGDGRDDIVTANGPGLQPVVSVYSGVPTAFSPAPYGSFLAFDHTVRTGVRVAAGDLDGDGRADIAAVAVTADGPTLKIFDGATGALLRTLFPFAQATPDSLRVAIGDVTGDGKPDLVVSGDTPSGPRIEVLTALGAPVEALPGVGYDETVAIGDVTGDGKPDVVVSDGPGWDSRVVVLAGDGRYEGSFSAYGTSFTNGIRVAAGDFAGDGGTEYLVGQGPGGSSQVDVLDDQGASLLTLHPFAGAGSDGAYVAAADVDGDGRSDIVVGAGPGGEPRVKVYDAMGKQLASFLAFDPAYHGGVRVAAGDVDGDGKAEIVVGTGPGDPAAVRVFSASGALRETIVPWDPFFTGGVFPAVGRLDGKPEIAVGLGAGSDGYVRTFDAAGQPLARFSPYGSGAYDIRVAIGDVLGDGRGEIVTTSGRVSPALVGVFLADGSPVGSFLAHPDFQGGLFLGVQGPVGRPLALTSPSLQGVEGSAAGLVVPFTAPPGESPADVAATVSWGDGTTSTAQIASLAGPGHLAVFTRHRYRRAGTYEVSVGVDDSFHRYDYATGTALVTDAAIRGQGVVVRLSRSRQVTGVVARFVDGNRLATAAGFTARIAWGDGTTSRGTVRALGGGRLAVLGAHSYRIRRAYAVVVRLADAGGARATARSVVR
jgi:hypothetical protein